MALVLLLGLVVPLGAMAEVPSQVTIKLTAELYPDGDWTVTSEFERDVYDNCYEQLGELLNEFYSGNCKFAWSDCKVDYDIFRHEDGYAFVSNLKESDLKNNIGKILYSCDVSVNGKKVTTISYQLGGYIHVPTAASVVPDTKYVYFEPGKPVTVQMPKMEIGGGETILYQYGIDLDTDYLDLGQTTKNTVTFTPTADYNGKRLEWSASTKGYDNWINPIPVYLLLNKKLNPIIVPDMAFPDNDDYQELAVGESTILTLPEAKAGEAGRKLKYRWYDYDLGGEYQLLDVQERESPALAIKNTGKIHEYVCKVGYADSPDGEFFEYPVHFIVVDLAEGEQPSRPSNPSTPSKPTPSTPAKTAPKTGDETPIIALFALMGIALAGTAVLVTVRRRRSEH